MIPSFYLILSQEKNYLDKVKQAPHRSSIPLEKILPLFFILFKYAYKLSCNDSTTLLSFLLSFLFLLLHLVEPMNTNSSILRKVQSISPNLRLVILSLKYLMVKSVRPSNNILMKKLSASFSLLYSKTILPSEFRI